MYTLAGISSPETGWGIVDESFETLNMLERYGEEIWFRLGDRDLATHILRTSRMRSGETLTEVTAGLSGVLSVDSAVLPMSDDPVSTVLETAEGRLEFQEYFVRRGQRDKVLAIELRGIQDAGPTERVLAAISGADAIVFCPSNPVVSVGPILALPGMTETLASSSAPKVAVSPIVGGRALKGPADRMLASLGHEVSATGVARLYAGLVDGMVVDRTDEGERAGIEALGMRVLVTQSVMRDAEGRARLASETLVFSEGSVAR
jgi:LPPG:FO 2-phospho-L-lactate transferase